MTDAEIIDLLDRTGHLRHPFGDTTPLPEGWQRPTSLNDPAVAMAIDSYQDFMSLALEPLIARAYPERRSAAVRPNGEIGPATRELMAQPRCACPDYGPAEALAAVGGGSWPRCHDIGDFHAASVRIDRSGLPSFLDPVFEEVLGRVRRAYDAIGLRFYFDGRSPVNIDFSFVGSSDGWIGLAIVGRNQSCGSTIWCRFLASYRGGSTQEQIAQQWTTLVMHELGHNVGLQHSRGGVMNPSIVNGLPGSWSGDPSEPLLRSWYGGKPVPDDEPPTDGVEIRIGEQTIRVPGAATWPPYGFLHVNGRPLEVSAMGRVARIQEKAHV